MPIADRDARALRVIVHRPGSKAPGVDAAIAWLGAQEGVRAVEHDAAAGAIVVRWRARAVERCALLDHVEACLRAEAPPEDPLTVTVAHALPGRVRLRLRGARAEAVALIAAALSRCPGVAWARGGAGTSSVVVSFDPEVTSIEALAAVAAEGAPLPERAPCPASSRRELWKLGGTALVFGAAVTSALPLPILLAAVSVTAIPSFSRAIDHLRQRSFNVDVLDATAIVVCVAQGDPIAAGAMTTLLALGDVILDRTQDRARKAISEIMALDAGDAFVLDEDGSLPRRVASRELAAGMRIAVYPGARVPADGVILEGSLAVDEKAITGESLPRERAAGDRVLAASVAVHGQAVVRVERAGSDTTAARIVQIIEGAGAKPMTLQADVERHANRLVVPTFALAGLSYLASGMIDRFASVIITDFGTGVRVAVPTTALASMTLAARRGVLVKGAQFLERLHAVDTVVFDKTGTLTRGVPEVTGVEAVGRRFCAAEIAAFAAAAEGNQSHPVADAIRRHAASLGAPVPELEHGSERYHIGLGLSARVVGRRVLVGNGRFLREAGVRVEAGEGLSAKLAARGVSSVLVAVDGALSGVIGYADALREESRSVVEALRAGGRRHVILLSGDARAPVEAIARRCGIDEAIGEVLPHDKAEVVRDLERRGKKVAMVGDGINDAPALALAHVGVSLRGGTEVALETADVVLLEEGLGRLPEVFALSDEAMRRVRQVLGIVIVPNAVAIVTGALGLINPMIAATLNNGSTIVATLHAAMPLVRDRRRG